MTTWEAHVESLRTNGTTNHQAARPKVPVLMSALPPGSRSRSQQVLRSSTMTGHTQPSQLSFEFSRV
jgi:hypothetical protein